MLVDDVFDGIWVDCCSSDVGQASPCGSQLVLVWAVLASATVAVSSWQHGQEQWQVFYHFLCPRLATAQQYDDHSFSETGSEIIFMFVF